jgi:acid phosphatase
MISETPSASDIQIFIPLEIDLWSGRSSSRFCCVISNMARSNLYERVIQTARMFVQGYMGPSANTLGNVVSINAKGGGLAVGNSLGPSDSCPTFKDTSGGDIPTTWDAIYLPPITARLNALLDGNLTLLDSNVNIFPYLCGFESQITGKLSPFCGVFTDEELKQYQYRQDLRYFYGLGPGASLAKNIFLPFLSGVVDILKQGPGVQGTFANGTSYTIPPLMMAFANDGQISEFSAAVGVFDEQEDLPSDHIPEDRIYYSSRFVSMRGTITLERLNCAAGAGPGSRSRTGTGTGSSSNSAVLTSAASPGSSTASSGFATITTSANPPSISSTDVKGSNPTHKSEKIKTAIVTETNPGPTDHAATPTPTVKRNHHHRRRSVEGGNSTYIRIMLNDAVYPLPNCQDGPGRSCLLANYADYVAVKYANAGNWADNCNVTDSAAPRVVMGASFFTDLTLPFLANVTP